MEMGSIPLPLLLRVGRYGGPSWTRGNNRLALSMRGKGRLRQAM